MPLGEVAFVLFRARLELFLALPQRVIKRGLPDVFIT